MFGRVLIANRGEIAVRVARTCREMGVGTVAVYSDPDASAKHVALADAAVHLPGTAATETYLNLDAVIAAARSTGAEAVHPGYGFLSERADAARAVTAAGIAWIGPSPEAVEAVGDKLRARRLAESAGVPVVPGTSQPITSAGEVLEFGARHGYPVAIKAAGGGGGRGFRVANAEADAQAALEGAAREAVAYFGSGEVYLERYVARPKHIEVQILSERAGEAIWLGARECSLQRRHQKLVEETPPSRFLSLIPALGDAAARVANACGYTNAGTVEFLGDEDGPFYFLEVNARLQVEHTITEEVTGLDLVACQLRIASGEPLGLTQVDLLDGGRFAPRGHSIECRINAENPAKRFLPSPGRIATYVEPAGPGVRVDGGFGEGDSISAAYDSLIAKLVVRGADREQARRRMLRALDEFVIEGVRTTLPAHRMLLQHDDFIDGSYSTRTVEGDGALDGLVEEARPLPDADALPAPETVIGGTPVRLWHPAIVASISAARPPSMDGAPAGGAVVSPMHGTILTVAVAAGDQVAAGETVAVLEAMKMETSIPAHSAGAVEEVRVTPGDVVEAGQVVALIR
jgi:acetyl-CoA/propionyl-CoA carboxylase, biotin carboxylase, biotin carboxyl carrier protein